MKKEILLWTLLIWQAIPNFTNWSIIESNKNQEIFDNFLEKQYENTNLISTNEIFEILQDNIKQEIIKWITYYFMHDVSFVVPMSNKELDTLELELKNYLNKYPNIITTNWNKVFLNLNDNNFWELFKILLPYLWKWKELNNYPDIIKNNDWLIIRHITKSKWENAEKHFFHQFWFMIMRIVEQVPWEMTIWYYKQEMIKIIPNKYIMNKDYSNIENLSITELPKYF